MSSGQSFRVLLRANSKDGKGVSAMGRDVNRTIRIIKRGLQQAAVTPTAESSIDVERGDAEKFEQRNAQAIVMRWVGEMRERKDEEAKAALGSLFRKAA